MTNKTTAEVWLVGAMYFNQKSLARLDSVFRNTEGYQTRLRKLCRVCQPQRNLDDLLIAIGVAAEDEAAISFLSNLSISKVGAGFLVLGTISDFKRSTNRVPRNEVAKRIQAILGYF